MFQEKIKEQRGRVIQEVTDSIAQEVKVEFKAHIEE